MSVGASMGLWWRLTYRLAKWKGQHICKRYGHAWQPFLRDVSDLRWCRRCWLTNTPLRRTTATNQTTWTIR